VTVQGDGQLVAAGAIVTDGERAWLLGEAGPMVWVELGG
jgi:hypothetical protein